MSEIVVPKNITTELFETVIRQNFNGPDIKVLGFKISMAGKSGDNYTSDVYRVTVEYQKEQENPLILTFIVKFMLEVESLQPILNVIKPFEKEIEMFLTVLPKLNEISGVEFSCICYHHTESPSKILILEDLQNSGFKIADRQAGMDFDHCKLVVDMLGKFHASSMVLAEREPKVFANYSFGMFLPSKQNSPDNFVIQVFRDSLNGLIKVAKDWPGFEEIVTKLKIISDNFFDAIFKCLEQSGEIKVKCLNHGDLWTNNIMFKYDVDSKPTSMKLIDFQINYYTSMGIDWNYFMHTSPTNEVREKFVDELIGVYYSSLSKTLIEQDFDNLRIPTIADVKNEIRKYEFYGFLASIGILPTILMEKPEGVEMSLTSFQDEDTNEIFTRLRMGGRRYQEAIKPILLRLNQNGTLDFS